MALVDDAETQFRLEQAADLLLAARILVESASAMIAAAGYKPEYCEKIVEALTFTEAHRRPSPVFRPRLYEGP